MAGVFVAVVACVDVSPESLLSFCCCCSGSSTSAFASSLLDREIDDIAVGVAVVVVAEIVVVSGTLKFPSSVCLGDNAADPGVINVTPVGDDDKVVDTEINELVCVDVVVATVEIDVSAVVAVVVVIVSDEIAAVVDEIDVDAVAEIAVVGVVTISDEITVVGVVAVSDEIAAVGVVSVADVVAVGDVSIPDDVAAVGVVAVVVVGVVGTVVAENIGDVPVDDITAVVFVVSIDAVGLTSRDLGSTTLVEVAIVFLNSEVIEKLFRSISTEDFFIGAFVMIIGEKEFSSKDKRRFCLAMATLPMT